MRVVMLRPTNWAGRYRRAGDEAEVDSEVARRWISRGIAKIAPGEERPEDAEQPAGTKETGATETADSSVGTNIRSADSRVGINIRVLPIAKLRALAKERGIPSAGRSKAELIEALEAVR